MPSVTFSKRKVPITKLEPTPKYHDRSIFLAEMALLKRASDFLQLLKNLGIPPICCGSQWFLCSFYIIIGQYWIGPHTGAYYYIIIS